MAEDNIANEIISYIEDRKNVLLIAPPGWGKTKLAAEEIVPRFRTSLTVTRTHREMEEFIRFTTVKAVPAYGRPAVCWKMSKDEFTYSACRAYNVLGVCDQRVRNEDVVWLLEKPRSPKEIKERAAKLGRCLYTAGVAAVKNADHVVTTYDFLLSNPWVAERKEVIVFDEVHSIMNYFENFVVAIYDVINELHSVYKAKKDPYVKRVITAIKSALRRGGGAETIIDLLDSVKYDADAVNDIIRAYYDNRYVEFDGSLYFLLSKTPVDVSTPLLSMTAYSVPPIIKHDKVVEVATEPLIKARIVEGVTSKYTERSEETYLMMAVKIRRSIRSDCGNLVVFPSRAFGEEVIQYLGVGRWGDKGVEEIGAGDVVYDVAGGSLTEGANIKGLCNVIVAGMPYPEPSPVLELLRKVYGFDVYTYIAILRTLQAIGRARRGTAVLIDDRFKYVEFPSWVEIV